MPVSGMIGLQMDRWNPFASIQIIRRGNEHHHVNQMPHALLNEAATVPLTRTCASIRLAESIIPAIFCKD